MSDKIGLGLAGGPAELADHMVQVVQRHDRIAAAAREVIRSADVYDQNPSLSNNAVLRASVVAWRAVREAVHSGAKP